MFNLSKYCTGVEKRKDGTLLYRGRGVFALLGQKKSVYVITNKTYNLDQCEELGCLGHQD